jgi:hypothetical protein
MVDPFDNIATDAHIGSVADAIREVIMIPDGMTIVEMPEKIRLAMLADVDGGNFTDIEDAEIFDAGSFSEEDHLVFDCKSF